MSLSDKIPSDLKIKCNHINKKDSLNLIKSKKLSNSTNKNGLKKSNIFKPK